MQNAFEQIEKQLDVKILLRNMLQFEKLKRLLLNDEQIKLFEFMPKPYITDHKIYIEQYENQYVYFT